MFRRGASHSKEGAEYIEMQMGGRWDFNQDNIFDEGDNDRASSKKSEQRKDKDLQQYAQNDVFQQDLLEIRDSTSWPISLQWPSSLGWPSSLPNRFNGIVGFSFLMVIAWIIFAWITCGMYLPVFRESASQSLDGTKLTSVVSRISNPSNVVSSSISVPRTTSLTAQTATSPLDSTVTTAGGITSDATSNPTSDSTSSSNPISDSIFSMSKTAPDFVTTYTGESLFPFREASEKLDSKQPLNDRQSFTQRDTFREMHTSPDFLWGWKEANEGEENDRNREEKDNGNHEEEHAGSDSIGRTHPFNVPLSQPGDFLETTKSEISHPEIAEQESVLQTEAVDIDKVSIRWQRVLPSSEVQNSEPRAVTWRVSLADICASRQPEDCTLREFQEKVGSLMEQAKQSLPRKQPIVFLRKPPRMTLLKAEKEMGSTRILRIEGPKEQPSDNLVAAIRDNGRSRTFLVLSTEDSVTVDVEWGTDIVNLGNYNPVKLGTKFADIRREVAEKTGLDGAKIDLVYFAEETNDETSIKDDQVIGELFYQLGGTIGSGKVTLTARESFDPSKNSVTLTLITVPEDASKKVQETISLEEILSHQDIPGESSQNIMAFRDLQEKITKKIACPLLFLENARLRSKVKYVRLVFPEETERDVQQCVGTTHAQDFNSGKSIPTIHNPMPSTTLDDVSEFAEKITLDTSVWDIMKKYRSNKFVILNAKEVVLIDWRAEQVKVTAGMEVESGKQVKVELGTPFESVRDFIASQSGGLDRADDITLTKDAAPIEDTQSVGQVFLAAGVTVGTLKVKIVKNNAGRNVAGKEHTKLASAMKYAIPEGRSTPDNKNFPAGEKPQKRKVAFNMIPNIRTYRPEGNPGTLAIPSNPRPQSFGLLVTRFDGRMTKGPALLSPVPIDGSFECFTNKMEPDDWLFLKDVREFPRLNYVRLVLPKEAPATQKSNSELEEIITPDTRVSDVMRKYGWDDEFLILNPLDSVKLWEHEQKYGRVDQFLIASPRHSYSVQIECQEGEPNFVAPIGDTFAQVRSKITQLRDGLSPGDITIQSYPRLRIEDAYTVGQVFLALYGVPGTDEERGRMMVTIQISSVFTIFRFPMQGVNRLEDILFKDFKKKYEITEKELLFLLNQRPGARTNYIHLKDGEVAPGVDEKITPGTRVLDVMKKYSYQGYPNRFVVLDSEEHVRIRWGATFDGWEQNTDRYVDVTFGSTFSKVRSEITLQRGGRDPGDISIPTIRIGDWQIAGQVFLWNRFARLREVGASAEMYVLVQKRIMPEVCRHNTVEDVCVTWVSTVGERSSIPVQLKDIPYFGDFKEQLLSEDESVFVKNGRDDAVTEYFFLKYVETTVARAEGYLRTTDPQAVLGACEASEYQRSITAETSIQKIMEDCNSIQFFVLKSEDNVVVQWGTTDQHVQVTIGNTFGDVRSKIADQLGDNGSFYITSQTNPNVQIHDAQTVGQVYLGSGGEGGKLQVKVRKGQVP